MPNVPTYRPIRVGEKLRETDIGRQLTIAGVTKHVSEDQYAAIVRAAEARRQSIDLFLASFSNMTPAAAGNALRIAITPHLPKGYQFVVAVRS